MIFELDSNRALFVAWFRAPKKRSGGGRKAPKLDTRAVSPKYLFDETKIYIFINRIPRIVCRIFFGIFQNFYISYPWSIFTDNRS